MEKNKLVYYIESVNFSHDQAIIEAGREAASLFIIKEGTVVVQNQAGKQIRNLHQWDFFGINSLIFNMKTTMTCLSLGDTEVYKISDKSFEAAMGLEFRTFLIFSIFKIAISKNDFFSELLPKEELAKLFNCFTLKHYSKGEKVYHKEKFIEKKVLIILEGDLVDVKGNVVAGRGTIYGESLIDQYE